MVGQVIETIGATRSGSDADWSHDIRQSEYPYAVVANKPTNTLRIAVEECLTDAYGDVSLTYFAPYVSRQRGVRICRCAAAVTQPRRYRIPSSDLPD
jgi:hypothetical protein